MNLRHLLSLIALFFTINTVFSQHSLNRMRFSNVDVRFTFPSKNVKGTFTQFSFPDTVHLDSLQPQEWKASIQVGSIETGNAIRDWHLMSKKYFNRKEFTTMEFHTESLIKTSNGYQIKGNIRIKGIQKPLELRIEKNPGKDYYTAIGKLFSSDFGIWIKKKKEENKVTFRIRFGLKESL